MIRLHTFLSIFIYNRTAIEWVKSLKSMQNDRYFHQTLDTNPSNHSLIHIFHPFSPNPISPLQCRTANISSRQKNCTRAFSRTSFTAGWMNSTSSNSARAFSLHRLRTCTRVSMRPSTSSTSAGSTKTCLFRKLHRSSSRSVRKSRTECRSSCERSSRETFTSD